jgi:hypothetical protein
MEGIATEDPAAVQKVAADTGVSLTAAAGVADEPVTVLVKQIPAVELMEKIADLLDYSWRRVGQEGPSRYEVWQDPDSRQRETSLRENRIREIERSFREALVGLVTSDAAYS